VVEAGVDGVGIAADFGESFVVLAGVGIRGALVTGVQTCALAVLGIGGAAEDLEAAIGGPGGGAGADNGAGAGHDDVIVDKGDGRSEERRVGKECRCGGAGPDYGEGDREVVGGVKGAACGDGGG